MLESYSRAWTEIDYDAIAHNVEEVRKLVKKTKIMGHRQSQCVWFG